jgi:nuclear transport factor 2 (NTF2) superfamily protein
MIQLHPLPPFNKETAIQKIQKAEDAWNSIDPINI